MSRNLSVQTLRVLAILAERPDVPLYGWEIMQRASLAGGTVYPILARLQERGWVTSQWEVPPPPGRTPRRFYSLTETGKTDGVGQARGILDGISRALAPSGGAADAAVSV